MSIRRIAPLSSLACLLAIVTAPRADAAFLSGAIALSGEASADNSILNATSFGLGPQLAVGEGAGDFRQTIDAVNSVTRMFADPGHVGSPFFTIGFALGGFNGEPIGTFRTDTAPARTPHAGTGGLNDTLLLVFTGTFTPEAGGDLGRFQPTPMVLSIRFSQAPGTTPIDFTATFAAAVPEPTSLAMLGAGASLLLALAAGRRAG